MCNTSNKSDDLHIIEEFLSWKVLPSPSIFTMQDHSSENMNMNTSSILVIGATGKVGRRVVAGLENQGKTPRIGSRDAHLSFDWEEHDNWPAHFSGVDTAYVSYYPDLASPQAAIDMAALIDVAKAAGLRRMVLLSGRGEAGAERCENLLRNSGLGYTLLRAAWFNQNFSEGHLYPGVMNGVIALPAGETLEPFIDIDDIAEIAVDALVDDRHHNQFYELTGPRLLTFAAAAEAIAKASGRNIQYAALSLDDFHAGMTAEMGKDAADLLTGLCREVFDGRNQRVTDGVERALGRPPRDFADYCRAAAASGVWRKAA